ARLKGAILGASRGRAASPTTGKNAAVAAPRRRSAGWRPAPDGAAVRGWRVLRPPAPGGPVLRPALGVGAGRWLVDGANGENALSAGAATLSEALRLACGQARAVGTLAPAA